MFLKPPKPGMKPVVDRSRKTVFTGKAPPKPKPFKIQEGNDADNEPIAPEPPKVETAFVKWLQQKTTNGAVHVEDTKDYLLQGPPYRGDVDWDSKDSVKDTGAAWVGNHLKRKNCQDKAVRKGCIAAGKIIKEIQNDPDRELTAHNVFHAYHQQSMAVNDADDSPFVDNTFNYRVDSMKGFVKQELYNGAARELARWKFTSESFLQFVNQMYINNCNYDPIFKALWENDTVRTACKDINANDEDVNIRTLVKLWARYAINGEYLEDLRELMALFPELYTQEPDSKWSPILQELEGTHDLHQESITRMQANNEGHNNHFLCQKQVDSMKLWQDFEVRPDDEHRSDFHKALFSHASVREDFDTLDFLFDLPHYGMAFKELMARLCLHGHSSPQHSSGSSHTQRTRRALRMLFSMSASGGCISPIRVNPSCIPPGVTIKASPAWLHWGLWERVRWSVKVRKYGLHWLEEWTKRVCRAEFDEDGSALMLGHEAKRMRIESMRHAGVPEKALETLKEAANEAARRYNEPIGQARERERKERVAANHETSA